MEIIAAILDEGLNVSFTFTNSETLAIAVFKKWEDGIELNTTKQIGNIDYKENRVPTALLRIQLQQAFEEFKNGAKMIGKPLETENVNGE